MSGIRPSLEFCNRCALSLFFVIGMVNLTHASPAFKSHGQGPGSLQLSQFTPSSFMSWRPYSNPYKLVQVGMNKGEVLAAAGKPDHEDSYYQGYTIRTTSPGIPELPRRSRTHLTRISDWYYVSVGLNPQTALLKFVGETLVSININLNSP